MIVKLTAAIVNAAKPQAKRYWLWDSEVTGFGVRINVTGSKTYSLKYTLNEKPAFHKIGHHGSPYTTELARREALRLKLLVSNGINPSDAKREQRSAAMTVSELCDLYWRAVNAGEVETKSGRPKKPSTIKTDEGRIERLIKPLLGAKRVADITSDDVRSFLRDVTAGKKIAADVKTGFRGRAIVRGGAGAAERTVGLLGGIFTFAISQKLIKENPVKGVRRPKAEPKPRYLTDDELARLGATLDGYEAAWTGFIQGANDRQRSCAIGSAPLPKTDIVPPVAITALRLLLLTGARKSEILLLRWQFVELGHRCLRLPDSKTGAKVILLPQPAVDLLKALPRLDTNPYVLPGDRPGRPFVGLQKVWERVRARAGLTDVRLHDLRHTYATVGVSVGINLPILGSLLSHQDPKTTKQYAHVADGPARLASETVAAAIAALLGSSGKAPIKPEGQA